MNEEIAAAFMRLLNALLNDEHGINHEAYNILRQMGCMSGAPKGMVDLLTSADAVNDRFFLPE